MTRKTRLKMTASQKQGLLVILSVAKYPLAKFALTSNKHASLHFLARII